MDNGVIVKYYFFGNQRVAMKRGTGAITYLHGDHLSSTALSTTSSGAFDVGQGYRGYGNYRTGGSLPTEHRFTGQKLDPTAPRGPPMYYNARYYDPALGHLIGRTRVRIRSCRPATIRSTLIATHMHETQPAEG